MDRLTEYRQIIRQVLVEYARFRPANGEIDTELVVDAERDHFETCMWAGTASSAFTVR